MCQNKYTKSEAHFFLHQLPVPPDEMHLLPRRGLALPVPEAADTLSCRTSRISGAWSKKLFRAGGMLLFCYEIFIFSFKIFLYGTLKFKAPAGAYGSSALFNAGHPDCQNGAGQF
jgi:hypothetical protein